MAKQALKRKLLEGALRPGGLARRAKRQGAKPFRRESLRLSGQELQGLLCAARLQLGCGLLQRAGDEMRRQLGIAEDRAADELFLQVVLVGIAHIGACGNAAHEEGRNEEMGGSEAHRT